METRQTTTLAVLHLCILIWAATSLFAKLIDLPASDIIYLRSMPALLAVSLVLLLSRTWKKLGRDQLVYALFIGLLTTCHWVSFYQSVQLSSIAVGMITLYTYPLFSVFLEPLIQRQRLNPSDAIIALLGLLGIACIAFEEWQQQVGVIAIGYGLLASLTFAMRNLGSRYLTPKIPSLMQIWIQLLVTFLVLALFSGVQPVTVASQSQWLMLALLGIVFVAFPHTLFLWTIKRLPVARASLIGMIQPVYAVILAWLILAETPTLLQMIGGLIVLTTAIITTRRHTA